MTQEEIQLLIQDICARLQSGLICSIYREDDEGFGWRDAKCKGYFQNNGSYEFYFDDVITIDNIERLKPYLRPLSSMTEDEFKELKNATDLNYDQLELVSWPDGSVTLEFYLEEVPQYCVVNVFNWLNTHHFDYRGLITMGLALEAPEGMYN